MLNSILILILGMEMRVKHAPNYPQVTHKCTLVNSLPTTIRTFVVFKEVEVAQEFNLWLRLKKGAIGVG
jgi:hypothetical protein